MTEILRRELAPISQQAWAEIDETAGDILREQLSARTVVDFRGPLGMEASVVNLGRLELPKTQKQKAVQWGLRQVIPLIEMRAPFTLDQWELDNRGRGAEDTALDALEEAARQAARFEEQTIYYGSPDGSQPGLLKSLENKPVALDTKIEKFTDAVGEAENQLRFQGVGGPYVLVLGEQPTRALKQITPSGQPLREILPRVFEGEIRWSPALEGGLLLSARGGDFELTVGQDLAVGYEGQQGRELRFYLTESFAFRVLDPTAAVELKLPARKR